MGTDDALADHINEPFTDELRATPKNTLLFVSLIMDEL